MTYPFKEKVYQGVLEQIKAYIDSEKLQPGDKLPSERMLSEQLQVGRSSIREALRALELLGLIETRRGEGTFMRAYRPYHMVELLSKFILNDTRTREELVTAKEMLEKEVLFLTSGQLSKNQLEEMRQFIDVDTPSQYHEQLFTYLFDRCNHPLLLSMWQLVCGFASTVHELAYPDDLYRKLYKAVQHESKDTIIAIYEDRASLN
ncbi:FadR/GntR family transcriptional regulator [Halobacillus sp. Marseille-Q1614]|uniref:FadR/GntR family transcriptional regulator n=1 Tax=Halobacillus sp. Marseille-Q1614 TaxID=2709134 RepID=UPI00156FFF72|nr:GntR family transcriptional regulator [Halobacillus sp. Marseille-Q1614]